MMLVLAREAILGANIHAVHMHMPIKLTEYAPIKNRFPSPTLFRVRCPAMY